MKRAVVLLLAVVLLSVACGQEKPKPLSEAGEKLYPLTGEILGRTPADNSLRIKHETIPGYMVGMTMEFPVRGAEVATLPADGTKIDATLHVTATGVWVTDVKAK